MQYNPNIHVAMEVLGHDLMYRHPEKAAVFLLTVLFPELTAKHLQNMSFKKIDFTAGVFRTSSAELYVPELVLDLLERVRETRLSTDYKVFRGLTQERHTQIKETFNAYMLQSV